MKKYWMDLYDKISSDNPPSYDIPGLHCTSTVISSYLGGMGGGAFTSPGDFLYSVVLEKNKCGKNKGKGLHLTKLKKFD